MIHPERDPHWCLGVEHGEHGLERYTFQDAENQRRYVLGYLRGDLLRRMLLAAHPYQQFHQKWLVWSADNTGHVWKR